MVSTGNDKNMGAMDLLGLWREFRSPHRIAYSGSRLTAPRDAFRGRLPY